ncbi:negative regulator of differentiation 1 [Trichoderma asperellum]|uniref:Negative regulator of differentiation 1 n=1 Tax=Trichoderma asperellum TaxID=101201 RepID=A0A6V8R589_TRIAP|nr:negative regulator of differentiation 1 [Trichoderma asperellum]
MQDFRRYTAGPFANNPIRKFAEPLPEDTVTIPRADYENLVRTAQNHSDLCRCLLSTPITDVRIIETLNACLSSQAVAYPNPSQGQDPYAIESNANDFDSISYASTPRTVNCRSFTSSPYIDPGAKLGIYPFPPPPQGNQTVNDGINYGEISSPKIYGVDDEHEASSEPPDRAMSIPKPDFPRAPEQLRSVRLINLPEGTTYSDIAGVIRGGLVYEFYITTGAATATVTFVEAASAEVYFAHVRNNGLFLKNKKIGIRWSQRYQTIPGHHANRIAKGATRNIVLRKCGPNHTEASVREDLEHIHNLQVVNVEFRGGDCHIGTNSVASAMYARTCMTSRLKYKTSRIEWDVDECAQPLNEMPSTPHQCAPSSAVPQRQARVTTPNRFQVLASKEE